MKKTNKEYKPQTQCVPQPKPELADKELLAAMDNQNADRFRLTSEQVSEAFNRIFKRPIAISRVATFDWDQAFNVQTPLTLPINPLTTVKISSFKKAK